MLGGKWYQLSAPAFLLNGRTVLVLVLAVAVAVVVFLVIFGATFAFT